MEEFSLIKKRLVPIFIFTFISIFEPPFLPIPLIYLQGFIEITFIFFSKVLIEKKIRIDLFNSSGMSQYYRFIAVLWVWISISRIIDIIIFNGETSFSNWLGSTNQLLVLTFIEFLNINIIIRHLKEHKCSLENILNLIVDAGTFQGILSLLSFLIPSLRMMLLKFAGDIYSNSWVLERRGYGFSATLLDGFGFGMGLIAGIVIIRFNFNSAKSIILQLIQLFLIVFSISINSRTGLIIVLMALIIKFTISKSLRAILIRVPIVVIVFYISIYALIPLVNAGMGSSNVNINWIASDFGGLIKAVIPTADINTTFIQAQATNNPYFDLVTNIQFPNNFFQLLFGKGWQIYEKNQLGYRSDNGYINMVWMIGFIGMLLYYLYNFYMSVKVLVKSNNIYSKLLLFNFVSLLIYSIKGRPIGYSPGIVVFYMILFSTTYYISYEKHKDEV